MKIATWNINSIKGVAAVAARLAGAGRAGRLLSAGDQMRDRGFFADGAGGVGLALSGAEEPVVTLRHIQAEANSRP